MPLWRALVFASVGNILAIILNYWLGYWLYEKTKTKLTKSKTGTKALAYGGKYGYFILPFTWLPVIGDPLTLVAGVLRLNFYTFVLVSGSLRVLRYYALYLLF
ncbi:MAG: DedA family protein [Sulfurimonas sp.]|jgi:membrane protein YqaA with SNARE-associated domain|nr:DedA family protein [Sulfurimonas sp.]